MLWQTVVLIQSHLFCRLTYSDAEIMVALVTEEEATAPEATATRAAGVTGYGPYGSVALVIKRPRLAGFDDQASLTC